MNKREFSNAWRTFTRNPILSEPKWTRPFTEWLQSIRDPKTQNRILRRLDRLTRGNFGECKSVGGGVFELILDFGPGYRIYFSEIGNIVVLLLCGGDKGSQIRDIERAKMYWREYKEVNQ